MGVKSLTNDVHYLTMTSLQGAEKINSFVPTLMEYIGAYRLPITIKDFTGRDRSLGPSCIYFQMVAKDANQYNVLIRPYGTGVHLLMFVKEKMNMGFNPAEMMRISPAYQHSDFCCLLIDMAFEKLFGKDLSR